MLSIIRDALGAAGLIDSTGETIRPNIGVSAADNLAFEFRGAGGDWLHVKASRYSDLEAQFKLSCLARERFGKIVPEPLAHIFRDGWSILVTRSVEFLPLCANDLTATGLATVPQKHVVEFFKISRDTAPGATRCDAAEADPMLEFFGRTAGTTSAEYRFLLSITPTEWSLMPRIPQHGDLAINNIGRLGHDQLIVFDWEDYEATTIAGFDICVLSLSLSGFSSASLKAMRDTPNPRGTRWEIARSACDACGLDYGAYRRWIPLYVLIFRYLKRNYGSSIRARTDSVLAEILA